MNEYKLIQLYSLLYGKLDSSGNPCTMVSNAQFYILASAAEIWKLLLAIVYSQFNGKIVLKTYFVDNFLSKP